MESLLDLTRGRLAANLLVALAIILLSAGRVNIVDREQERIARKPATKKSCVHLGQSKVATGGFEAHYSDEGGDGWVVGWVDAGVDALPVRYIPL